MYPFDHVILYNKGSWEMMIVIFPCLIDRMQSQHHDFFLSGQQRQSAMELDLELSHKNDHQNTLGGYEPARKLYISPPFRRADQSGSVSMFQADIARERKTLRQ